MPDTSTDKAAAYRLVLRWSYLLGYQQILRLRAARYAAVESDQSDRANRCFGHEEQQPFHILEGEKHYAMVAARQLVRALKAFDGDLRLPPELPEVAVLGLRDALEHWDEPEGRARSKAAARGEDPDAHQFSVDGNGRLGDAVDDLDLEQWGQKVYQELYDWDPR